MTVLTGFDLQSGPCMWAEKLYSCSLQGSAMLLYYPVVKVV